MNNNDDDATLIDGIPAAPEPKKKEEKKEEKAEDKKASTKKEDKSGTVKNTIAGVGLAAGALSASAMDVDDITGLFNGTEETKTDTAAADTITQALQVDDIAASISSDKPDDVIAQPIADAVQPQVQQNIPVANNGAGTIAAGIQDTDIVDNTLVEKQEIVNEAFAHATPKAIQGNDDVVDTAPVINIPVADEPTVNNIGNVVPAVNNVISTPPAIGDIQNVTPADEPTVGDLQPGTVIDLTVDTAPVVNIPVDANTDEPVVNDIRNVGGVATPISNVIDTIPVSDIQNLPIADEPSVNDLRLPTVDDVQMVQMPDGTFEAITPDVPGIQNVDVTPAPAIDSQIQNINTDAEPSVGDLGLDTGADVQVIQMPDGSFDTITTVSEDQPAIVNVVADDVVTNDFTPDIVDNTVQPLDDSPGMGDSPSLDDISHFRGE